MLSARNVTRSPGARRREGDQPAPGRRRVQEAGDRVEQLRLVQQKGVVALVGLDLDEADIGRHRVQRVHDLAALARRIEPVAGEGDDAEARLHVLEGVGQRAAMVGGEVEIVHGAGDVEIGVGVEAVDEGRALMAQIALHLEIGVEAEGQRVAVLQLAAEFLVQRLGRQIGDVRGHARDRQTFARRDALLQIAAVPPVRIGHHRLPADLVEGDILRGMARRGGDRHGGEHLSP